MTSSKPNYDLDPLEDLPPPSYAQATANTSQQPPDARRPAVNSESSPRSNGIMPSMEVAGARASMAAQDASSSEANMMNARNQHAARSNQDLGQGPGFTDPERGIGGTRLGHGPAGRIIGRLGERFGVTQGPQQPVDRNGPNQIYGPEGIYERNDYYGNGPFGGPLRGGFGPGGRGGGLLGRGGGVLGGMGGPRERRWERRCARREGRWERRAF